MGDRGVRSQLWWRLAGWWDGRLCQASGTVFWQEPVSGQENQLTLASYQVWDPLRTVFFRSWRLLWIRACDCVNTPARTQLSLLKTVRKASLHKAEITNEVNSRWELIYREPFWIFLGRQEAAGELCIDERRTAIFQEDDPGRSQFKMPASHTAMSARKLFWGLVCKAPWTPRSNSSIKRKDGATEPCNWIPSAVSAVPAQTVPAQLQSRPQEGSLTRSCPKHCGRISSLRLGNDQHSHSLLGNSLDWEKVHSTQARATSKPDAKLQTWNVFKSTNRTKLWWSYR